MAPSVAIWVVDDDSCVLKSVVTGLSAAGLAARGFSSGHDVLAALGDDRPDILLSDVLMPECNGVELADAVRAQIPRLPVLLMSGGTGTVDPARLEAYPLLAKPFTARALLAAVDALIGIN